MILAAVVVATAGAYFYWAGKPKKYSADATIFVSTSGIQQSVLGSVVLPSSDRTVANQARLLHSRSVATAVQRRLKSKESVDSLLQSVATQPSTGRDFMVVEATRSSPADAARVANAFAESFISLQGADFRKQVEGARLVAQRQLEALPSGSASLSQRQTLQQRIAQLDALRNVSAPNAQLTDKAEAPIAPSYPKPVRNAIFAFLLSGLAAIALAYGLSWADRRLTEIPEIEETFGVPMLASLPFERRIEGLATSDDNFSMAKEQFRTLRTNIQLSTLDRPARRLLITSSIAAEGKSTITANLAVAYQEAGYRTIVVDCDLRRPTASKLFGIDNEPGLTDVLVGRVELDRAVCAFASPDGGGALRETPAGTIGQLFVLPGGVRPPNPSALLSTQHLHGLLDRLQDEYDIVLLDSPPVLAVADALSLASIVDAVVVVARAGVVTRPAARRVATTLDRIASGKLIGVVANAVSASASRDTGTYYYYSSRDEVRS